MNTSTMARIRSLGNFQWHAQRRVATMSFLEFEIAHRVESVRRSGWGGIEIEFQPKRHAWYEIDVLADALATAMPARVEPVNDIISMPG